MNQMEIFKNPEFGTIRAVEIDGEPWLVGKDVALALGYKNPQEAIRNHVDAEDKGVSEILTPGGMQKLPIINESGLYSLVLSSKLPKAKQFRRWVTSEVLPSIRKHGAYLIKAEAVLTLIADMLRAIAEYSKNDRAEFIRTVQETQAAQQTADISKKRKRLAAAQKRAGELEKLICKIYEDNALGKLPDARYEALDAQYAKEQDALNAEITELEKAVTGYEQSRKSAEKFIALIDKYENFDTLTNTMLNEFVEKILVHERARKGSQDTTQEVEIYFNFVGRYIPPALQPVPLTPEEQEELRKKEERKDRLHQNYLRRKANGKQKEWEERYNAKRKAKMEAAKAAIRAEDMEKGIFTTVSQLPKQEPRKATLPASAAV